jgi:hypothetical protein
MLRTQTWSLAFCLIINVIFLFPDAKAQDLPKRYATLELFTNTPCPICASQIPGLYSRLANYEGVYHLVSFYPGKPYSSCIFYQANIPDNTARWQFYTGEVFGTPTVALNGIDFKNSNGVTNTVMDGLTGGESWLEVQVEETAGTDRDVTITLEDHVGGSATTAQLFAVIVEKEVHFNAPNGETVHHNVFRDFLTPNSGVAVDMTSGTVTQDFSYTVNAAWQADQVYVVAWLSDPTTKEIFNSGTRFDPDFISAVDDPITTKLHLYPNPASTEFQIVVPEISGDVQLSIFDASGRIHFAQNNLVAGPFEINCDSWPLGIYLATLKTASGISLQKIHVLK